MRKHIKILGMKYRLIKAKPDSEKLEVAPGFQCYAVIDHINNKIYISKGSSRSRVDNSLLHEIVHAIDIELKLGLSHKCINRLASGLHSAGVKIT